jgi:hypothetical protein
VTNDLLPTWRTAGLLRGDEHPHAWLASAAGSDGQQLSSSARRELDVRFDCGA